MAGTPKRLGLSLRLAAAVTLAGLGLPAQSVTPPLPQPSWVELGETQQRILAPLASEWDSLESWRRKKWLGIAERYPQMGVEEQQRIQQQMRDWVRLTPEQRRQAREHYRQLQQSVTPEQKELLKQKWQEYRELPAEEKQRLQRQAARQSPAQRSLPIKPPVVIVPPVPVVVDQARPPSTESYATDPSGLSGTGAMPQ